MMNVLSESAPERDASRVKETQVGAVTLKSEVTQNNGNDDDDEMINDEEETSLLK